MYTSSQVGQIVRLSNNKVTSSISKGNNLLAGLFYSSQVDLP